MIMIKVYRKVIIFIQHFISTLVVTLHLRPLRSTDHAGVVVQRGTLRDHVIYLHVSLRMAQANM